MPALPASILITGASSGLGAALARTYAAPGVTLCLSALEPDLLASAAAVCRERGATVSAVVLDVRDRAAMASWLRSCDAARPLDLVIANAGISASSVGGAGEDEDLSRAILATNLDGVLNTVFPAVAAMQPRGRGQIAIMSSLAGYRGTARSAAYCASKAAIRVWGEGLRARLSGDGIRVSVICPGFVATRLTERKQVRGWFVQDAERAARTIVGRLARGQALIGLPAPMAWGARLTQALPEWLLERLARRFTSRSR